MTIRICHCHGQSQRCYTDFFVFGSGSGGARSVRASAGDSVGVAIADAHRVGSLPMHVSSSDPLDADLFFDDVGRTRSGLAPTSSTAVPPRSLIGWRCA